MPCSANTIAQIDIRPPRLTKKGFVAGGAAAIAVAGGLALAIRLRFHNRAPQQLATCLTLYQQAANQRGGDELGGAGEEELGSAGKRWVVMVTTGVALGR